MNNRRLLIVLFFLPVTGLFLFMFGTSLVLLIVAILLETVGYPIDQNGNLLPIGMSLALMVAFIGAFFLNKAIYDSISKSTTKTQEGSVQISGNLIVKSMLYGALGSIAPYLLAILFGSLISSWDPDFASGIYEAVGILGTLACLPTIFIGAILGGLFVWLVVKFEGPRRIFLRIENSNDSRWIFLVGFIGGFLATPIFGMFAAIIITLTGNS